MTRNYLKEGWGRSFVFIIAIFLLIVLGLIQPHASEKVANYADLNSIAKNRLMGSSPMLFRSNKLTDILSKLGDLKEKLQQLNRGIKSNNPAFHLQSAPPLFREVLKGQPGNLKSKQMHFMREIHKLKMNKESMTKANIIVANGEVGTITGTVTDDTMNPINDLHVYVKEYDTNEWINGGNTNPSGFYTIDVPPGDYRVRACPNCDPQRPYVDEYYNNTHNYEEATLVTVTAGKTKTCDFVLEEGCPVTGHVDDEQGIPVDGVWVELVNNQTDQWASEDNTDDGGNYTIRVVPGTYRIEVDDRIVSRYVRPDPKEVEVTDDSCAVVGDTDFVLKEGCIISGTVSDSEGPLGGVRVEISHSNWDYIGATETNPDGSYTFHINPGDYVTQVFPPSQYAWPPPSEIAVLGSCEVTGNTNIVVGEGCPLSGQVEDENGNPVSGFWIFVVNKQTDHFAGEEFLGNDGNYTIRVLPGIYSINVYGDFQSRCYVRPDSKEVGVNDSCAVTGETNFVLEEGGIISGEIIFDDWDEGSIEVWALDDLRGQIKASTTINSPGPYTVRGVPFGTDVWVISFWNYPDSPSPWPDCGDYFGEYGENPITLIDGEPGPTDIDMTLEEIECGTISGTVTDGVTPIGNLHVFVSDYDTNEWVNGGHTDPSSGFYTIDVPPGDYRVRACPNCDDPPHPYMDEYYDNTYSYDSATPVTVSIDETEACDFILETGVEVCGTIRKEIDGTGIGNIDINIWNKSNFETGCETDGYGNYCARVLPSVEGDEDTCYRVKTRTDCAYVDECYCFECETTNWDDATPVCATTDQSGINISLHGGNHISGTIHLPEGGPGFNPWDLWIGAYSGSGEEGDSSLDDDWNFCIALNPEDDYVLQITPPEYTNYIEGYYQEGAPGNFTWIEEDATRLNSCEGNLENINVILQEGGTISGQITASDDQPIANIRVQAFSGKCWNNLLREVHTDKNGQYTIYGFPDGDVYVRACPECVDMDYLSEWWDDAEGTTDCNAALPVTVVTGQDTPGIDFILEEGGSVSGRVTTSDGQPIEGVQLQVFLSQCWDNHPGGANTDENGNYTIHALPEGDVYVYACASCEGLNYVSKWWDDAEGTTDCNAALPVTVVTGQNIPGIDFSLDEGGIVSGHVTTSDGQPIEGVRIMAFSKSCWEEDYYADANSDENGNYTIPGIISGDVYVWAFPTFEGLNYINEWWDDAEGTIYSDAAVPVNVVTGQNTPGIDFILDDGESISGQVTTNDGQPIEGVWIMAFSKSCWVGYYGVARTDENGRYILIGLRPEEVYLYASINYYINEWWNGAQGVINCKAALPVILVPGIYTTGIDFILEEDGSISGRVTTSDGQPLESVLVSAFLRQCGDDFLGQALAGEDGNYTIPGMPSGDVYIYACANCVGLNYISEWWDEDQGTIDCNEGVPVTVMPGQTLPDIDFSLEGGGIISGQVTTSDGQPLEGVLVSAFLGQCGDDFLGQALADEDGNYTIPGMPSGDVYIYACANCVGLNYVSEWWDEDQGTIDCNEGVPVTVMTGQTLPGIDFSLEEGGIVSGQVTTIDNEPIPNLQVEVFLGQCGDNHLGRTNTDENGNYTIHALPEGNVYIHTCAECDELNYVDEWWDNTDGTVDCDLAEPVSVIQGDVTPDINFSLELKEADPLIPDEPYEGEISPLHFDYFSLDVEGGRSLVIEVVPKNGISSIILDGKLGEIPQYPGKGEYTTSKMTHRGIYELLISPTDEGTYYFSMFGQDIESSGGSYTIRAYYVDQQYLSDISIDTAGNEGTVTVCLEGIGFSEDTVVTLTGGGPDISPIGIVVVSPTQICVTFDLDGAIPGIYDVRIEKTGETPSVLEDAFEVTGGMPGHLRVSLMSPDAVRPSRNYTCWLEYENDGGSDLPAPLFIISNNVDAKMRLSKDEPFKDGRIQVLGVNFEGSAGTLPPGSCNRIPVYFQVPTGLPGHSLIEFTVEKMTADSTLIDWSAIEGDVRPDDIDDDAWAVIWSNLQGQVGSTWAEYLETLNNDATYLSLYRSSKKSSLVGGELSVNELTDITLYDVIALLRFELYGATGGMSPRTVLAGAQDVFVPAPGLPITFGRFAFQAIQNRFRLGPLGRGWTHMYEYSASTVVNGDIHIKGPDGSIRIFVSLGNDEYQGSAGDYGTVSSDGETTILREKDGMTWRFGASGKLSSIEDTNGNMLALSYTGDSLSSVSHSNGESISFAYNGNGRISQVTDPAGRVIAYGYDASSEHLVGVEKTGGILTLYSYNASDGTPSAHALNTITFPDGTHYYYSYDERGRLTDEWADGDAGYVTYTYESPGTIIVTDALGNTALIRYGSQGEILEIQDPLGAIVQSVFDGKIEIPHFIGPDGKAVSIAYDSQGNPVGIKDALNNLVQMGFEPDYSRLTKLVDQRSNETEFSYDGKGNLETITYPDTNAESFAYDAAGNVTTYTNCRSDSIDYTYNNRGQITRKTWPGRTVDYTYDLKGNLISATDSVTGTITMQYDDRDFLTRINHPGGYWFSFEYNDSGQRTKRVGHDGNTINYEYDMTGKLYRMTDGSGNEIVRYEYDKNGLLKSETKGNGTQTTYEYDAAGQLLHMLNYAPGGAVQSRFDYTYDVNGNRTSMTTLDGTTSYQYDAIGQLTGGTYPDSRQVTYQYDAAGNRISVTDNGVATSYNTNNMNQYTQVGDISYNYDADGNMISKTDAAGTTTYEYDYENRLIRVVTPSDGTWEYTYDALGNRISVSLGGNVTRYVHDPIGLVDVAAEYDGSGALVARYTHGLGLVNQSDSSGNQAFYNFDGIGHTRQLTDATGAVVNTYDYSPFGIPLQVDETISNPFGYVGRFGVMEEKNGLQFMRARYYEPMIGRFVSQDPIRIVGGINLYLYCSNKPVNFVDPIGLKLTLWQRISSPLRLIRHGNWLGLYNSGGRNDTSRGDIGDLRVEGVDLADKASKLHDILYHEGVKNAAQIAKEWLRSEVAKREALGEHENVWEKLWRFGFLHYPDKWLDQGLDPPTQNSGNVSSENITPEDPNEKAGPVGIGDQHYVVSEEEMTYTVYFENKETASAPAQEVFINDYLDEDLDWSTFRLGEIGFGDQVVSSLAGKESGQDRVILEDLAVDIEAQRYPGTGLVSWTLRSIDLETGELPEDPFAGFLPPEDGTGRGQGYVTFTVGAKDDLPAGTKITNLATIVFDTEAPISTNEVFNTITDDAPEAPSEPSIADGADDIPVSNVLSCASCEFATSYDFYIWKSGQQKPGTPTGSDLDSPFYCPAGDLEHNTTYYWQVVARNVMGATEGSVWSFTTEAGPVTTTTTSLPIISTTTIPSVTTIPPGTTTTTTTGPTTTTTTVRTISSTTSTSSSTTTIIIIPTPPEITSSPVTTATVNALYSYDVECDPENNLTFSLNTAPSGMNIDEGTGLITWTPTIFQLGDRDIEVQAEDEYDGSDTQEFVIHVSLFPWCPMSLALENEKDLNIIRRFRDRRLSSTSMGKDYMTLFYKHSDEVTLILLLDPKLTSQTAGVIGKLLPKVDSLIKGESTYVDEKTIKEIDVLLDGIDAEASPSLKSDIRKIKKDINKGELFKQLGITISE